MKIVIDMPEEQYIGIKMGMWQKVNPNAMYEMIENGTPLPKGHGRIIDESQVSGTFTWDSGYIECFAPTIIEADKENENADS